MPHIVYLGKLQVQCSCGARVVPDPAFPMDTILHECADCRILQSLPPEGQFPEPDALYEAATGRPDSDASLGCQGPVKGKDARSTMSRFNSDASPTST